jgi:hypothetical protein
MNSRPRILARGFLAMTALIASSLPVIATEGGLGRTIEGTVGGPGAGVAPTDPGTYVANQIEYYTYSARAARPLPISGKLAAALNADTVVDNLTLTYVPRLRLKGQSFSFGATVAPTYLKSSASLSLAGRSLRESEHSTALGDITLMPVTYGWLRPPHFWEVKLLVAAPTGRYTSGSLVNAGLNCWTFMPQAAYTFLNEKTGLDLSAIAGFDFYTEDGAAHYTSGTMFHLDLSAVRSPPRGWGYGVIYGWQEQVSDDSGGLAGPLNGFRGHAMTVGPIGTFSVKGQSIMDVRFLPEFDVKNRPSGWSFVWNAYYKF